MGRLRAALGASFVLGAWIAGCGAEDSSGSGNANGTGDTNGAGGGGFATNDSGTGDGPRPCVGLECKQVSCPGGGTTSLSGKVYDPSGTVPLYDAVVYVPNAELTPFTEGVTCDRCGTAPSGNPIATALTNSKGEFTLGNVPVGVDIPLVVQIGRWRRKVVIPAVAQCTNTSLDAGVTRLPRNKAEGEIPRIAITTGSADSLECFLMMDLASCIQDDNKPPVVPPIKGPN